MGETAAAPRVLIVDDDPAVRSVFGTSLALMGFDVVAVGDGLDALNHIEQDPPDVIVLDLMLPRLGGLSVQQEISARPDLRHIAIVIVSGAHEKVVERRNVCVLHKPIDVETLVRTIRECLAKVKRRPAHERRRPAAQE